MPKTSNAPDELANMSIEELIALKDRIDQLIQKKVQAEKKTLLAKLETIRRFESREKPQPSHTNGNGLAQPNRRAKASPKYRNPITGETWAGRGLQPKWMRKAIEAGHSQDEFLIAN